MNESLNLVEKLSRWLASQPFLSACAVSLFLGSTVALAGPITRSFREYWIMFGLAWLGAPAVWLTVHYVPSWFQSQHGNPPETDAPPRRAPPQGGVPVAFCIALLWVVLAIGAARSPSLPTDDGEAEALIDANQPTSAAAAPSEGPSAAAAGIEVTATAAPTASALPTASAVPPPATPTAIGVSAASVPTPSVRATALELIPGAPEGPLTLSVFLDGPPNPDAYYWALREDLDYPGRRPERPELYPQALSSWNREDPYLEFAVFLPIPGRNYRVTVIECTELGDEIVAPVADKWRNDECLDQFPRGCATMIEDEFSRTK